MTESSFLTLDDISKEFRSESNIYHSKRVKIDLLNNVITPVLLIGIWILGVPNLLARSTGTEFSYWGVVLMTVYYSLILTTFNLPFDFLKERLERTYGFSTMSWNKWAVNMLKMLGLQVAFYGISIGTLYYAIDLFPSIWWLYGFLGGAIFVSLIQAIVPLIIIPLFMKLEPFPEGEVRDRIKALADRLEIGYKDIYRIQLSEMSTKANAMVTGFGNTLRIAIGDTLADNFTPEEIEVVMAHEIGHQRHKDIYRFVILISMVLLVAFYLVDIGFDLVINMFGYTSKSDPRTVFYLLTTFLLITLIVQPFTNWYSRRRERAADVFAIMHLPDIEIYESAFVRLALQNMANLHPSTLDVILNYTHPPIKDRIMYAKSVFKKGMS